MIKQDFTEAAMVTLNYYLRLMQKPINEKLPESIGKLEIGMGGEWTLPLTDGLVMYATPFFEMGEGLSIIVDDSNENTVFNQELPFEIVGDLDRDSSLFVQTVSIVDTVVKNFKSNNQLKG